MAITLSNNGLSDGRYTDDSGHVWTVARLIEHAKSLQVFDLPLSAVYIGQKVFQESKSARAIAEHVKRVNETDLSYPVIMDPDGFIMDGWHRVVKALVEGRETIKAVRFETLPSWEFTEPE